jgi:chitinase
MDQIFGQWDGSSLNPVQVLAMPVTMVQQAVESMQQVKAIGQTEEDLKKKELILTVVGAVLAVVPFVGDAAAAAAGLASLARAITLIGEVANNAFSIYDIVGDPQSAPMAIFGMLLGGGALSRDADSLAKMGALRRGMSFADLLKLGTIFSHQSSGIQMIVRSCSA